MRAPVFLLLIAFALQFNLSFAQTPERVLRLAVNKNNQLVISKSNGEIAFADSINGIWRKTLIGAPPKTWVNINNTCYFNADTAFVWGGIGDNYEKQDLIYRTVDRGKTWTPIKFGMDGGVSDAVFLDNGEAWLSVEKGIAYTKDYGLTWTSLSFPTKEKRFSYIYFNNKREGLVAGDTNGLAYTNDNCKTWINIPTPLNQGKYKKTDPFHESFFDGVAIFRDYLLVSQEFMVFYSRKDTINWVYMPGYFSFYTDPYNRALFFETNRGKIIKSNNDLKPVATFTGDFYKAFCRNGSLFGFHSDHLSQIDTGNQLVTYPVYTNDTSEIDAHEFGYNGHNTVGAVGNKIYLGEVRRGNWRYAFTLPFATDSGYLCMKGYDTVMFVNRSNDSLFYYSIRDGQVEKKEKKKMIADFSGAGIKKIIISKASEGDFYYYKNAVSFEKINGKFVRVKLDTVTRDGIMLLPKKIPDTLNYQKVTAFGKHIPDLYQKKINFDELGFTKADYDSCKKHILQFKAMLDGNKSAEELRKCPFTFNVNNLDFVKLLSLVDSIGRISPATIDDYLQGHHYNFSTDEDYIDIEMINTDGKGLLIHYLYYNGKQPFFFAWRIELNGLRSYSTDIEINRFFNDVFPDLLHKEGKVDLLQELVKFVYKQETQDN